MSNSTEATVTESEQGTGAGLREFAIAGAAGLVGTAVMTPVLAAAWVVGAFDLSAFASLTTVVGLPQSVVLGIVLFVSGGSTVLPLLYVTLSMFLPGRNLAEKGAWFAVVMWTGFAFAFYTGQTGTALVAFLVLTLAAHVAYGYAMGGVYERFAHPVEWTV